MWIWSIPGKDEISHRLRGRNRLGGRNLGTLIRPYIGQRTGQFGQSWYGRVKGHS